MDHKIEILSSPNEMNINLRNKTVILPSEIQSSINSYWNTLMAEGKKYTRGKVFMIDSIHLSDHSLNVNLLETDYAHYLYSKNHPLPDLYNCRVIYGAAMIVTSDGKIVIGEMGSHTANAGRLQFVAGGIDTEDITDGVVNLEKSIIRETKEEIGIDITDPQIAQKIIPQYLKVGGVNNSVTIIFKVILNIDSKALADKYNAYTEGLLSKGILPEFSSVLFVDRHQGKLLSTDKREKVDYLIPVLEKICCQGG